MNRRLKFWLAYKKARLAGETRASANLLAKIAAAR